MTAYAIGELRVAEITRGIRDYLARIDATLAPYGGEFMVYGGRKEMLEGESDHDLIVIAFPDVAAARNWYASAAYQKIVPLRRDGAEGAIYLIDGVGPEHRATDILR
ncbi:DUF1330 domain-containing protein [uncultured Paracoccus sp.]|uniref:DUF1330 domain-containing protein n=1 Tax=uncultured Paracoccus sp. TaxID=189685 RepID=UPI002619D066|nr:DUF1330 domain-containing protein [uncultured Paracoccus sp.]